MSGRLRITALDTAFDLTFSPKTDNTFRDAVAAAWSRCLAAPDGSATTSADHLPASPPTKRPDPSTPDDGEPLRAALQRLSQEVTRHLIAAQTGRLFMLHAGAVSHPRTGASVVFVAPSGTGKTTLARLLGRTHGYLTDETVGIDPATGRIHPYPKPLSIAPAHSDRWRKVETSPDALGLLPEPPNPTVSRIVLLRRDQAPHAPVSADELNLLDGVGALIPETSALNRLPRPLQTVADLLNRTGPALRLTYHEASDLVPVLTALLEESG